MRAMVFPIGNSQLSAEEHDVLQERLGGLRKKQCKHTSALAKAIAGRSLQNKQHVQEHFGDPVPGNRLFPVIGFLLT